MNILKLFLFFFFISCGGSEAPKDDICKKDSSRPECISEEERQVEREQAVQTAKVQENKSFSSVKECLDKKEADGDASARQNPTVIAECAAAIRKP